MSVAANKNGCETLRFPARQSLVGDCFSLFLFAVFLWVSARRGKKRFMLNLVYLVVILAVAVDINLNVELIFFARIVGAVEVVGKRILTAKQRVYLI